ncbi:hypothetical protein T01_5895 [Trichinella spiralis]|uniref:Uncharacterized protein n=1 Tax=Trichinella spiralis TaxID=6334 RepID=A0A0V1APE1_TRISP|nr:hypothetical protein T01_8137 [Trichinella spiralis]KRY31227.1 hypothetical protein T01_5895 [Trichinella spiralis]
MGPAKTNKGNNQSSDLRLGKSTTTRLRTKGGCENIEEGVTRIVLAAAEVGCQALVPYVRNVRQPEAASEQGSGNPTQRRNKAPALRPATQPKYGLSARSGTSENRHGTRTLEIWYDEAPKSRSSNMETEYSCSPNLARIGKDLTEY